MVLRHGDAVMTPIRILVDSFADSGLLNAQMGNAREIVSRLDPGRFHVSMFSLGEPDPRIVRRRNTRLVKLPERRQTVRILSEFLLGTHALLFYMKASPASRWYSGLRRKWRDQRTTIAAIESQADLKNEPTITRESIRVWEQTVLRCDYLFSNSSSVQRSLEREHGLSSEIIPTGVDTRFFTPDWDRPQNERPRVLFAGALRPFKQPQFLLTAAAHFPDAEFRIAGRGPEAAELKERVAREGLRNVALLGSLAAEKLREEYQRADVFLFPSAWEGSPKVILEAAACGIPVIARNNYSPETVVHEVTGFQAGSDEELLVSLKVLLNNPGLRRKMGHFGRLHSRRYDWDVITAQWEEAFERVAGKQEIRKVS
jgi:glycosyltransferase involved in cell wall biosynthesis